jgi:hypothetical protein
MKYCFARTGASQHPPSEAAAEHKQSASLCGSSRAREHRRRFETSEEAISHDDRYGHDCPGRTNADRQLRFPLRCRQAASVTVDAPARNGATTIATAQMCALAARRSPE